MIVPLSPVIVTVVPGALIFKAPVSVPSGTTIVRFSTVAFPSPSLLSRTLIFRGFVAVGNATALKSMVCTTSAEASNFAGIEISGFSPKFSTLTAVTPSFASSVLAASASSTDT